MSDQGVQQGTEHTTLRGPCDGISLVDVLLPTPTIWGAARQEVQDPAAEGAV